MPYNTKTIQSTVKSFTNTPRNLKRSEPTKTGNRRSAVGVPDPDKITVAARRACPVSNPIASDYLVERLCLG